METVDPRLLGAFVESGREIMGTVEDKVQVRVRKEGADTDRPSGEAAWAEIIHTTPRPVDGIADPQVHGHWVMMNAAWDPVEGRIKAAQLGDVHRDKPLLRALCGGGSSWIVASPDPGRRGSSTRIREECGRTDRVNAPGTAPHHSRSRYT